MPAMPRGGRCSCAVITDSSAAVMGSSTVVFSQPDSLNGACCERRESGAGARRRSEQRRSILCERRRRRRTHRAMREQHTKRAASVGNRAPAHGGEASRGVLSSASDDDGDGLTARCASSTQKKGGSGDMDDRTGVAVVGSINADLAAFGSPLPRPGETVIGTDFSLGLGGKGANQATA